MAPDLTPQHLRRGISEEYQMDMQKAAQGLVELGAAACSAQRTVRKLLGQHRDALPDTDGIDWDLLGAARKAGTLL